MERQRRARAVVYGLLATGLAAAMALGQGAARGAGGYDWPQFDDGGWSGLHSGANSQESRISPATVGGLIQQLRVSLPSVADGEPAELAGVSTPTGIRDLLFLTTMDGHILALDAHTGATVWSMQYGPGSCLSTQGVTCYTTSSPAIDPNRQYVYTYGLDGYVHKLSVGTGAPVTGGGWPELATLKSSQEKEAPALSIASTTTGTYLYVANGGYPGDAGDYQGHITAINLATGAQRVFNALCSNQPVHFAARPATPNCGFNQSAVWSRPGVIYDPVTARIYFATGNANFNPAGFQWGDSVLALHPDATGSSTIPGDPVDSYTPTNFAGLQAGDADLGSTAPAILPASAVPAASLYKHLAVQSGKDAVVRLLDLDNLSQQGAPGHTGGELASVPMPSDVFVGIFSQPAVWVNPSTRTIWVFVTDSRGIAAFTLTITGGMPGLRAMWSTSSTPQGAPGSSPLVVNGVLFDARPGLIEARDPTTGRQLWSDSSIGGIHWESPVIANGMLYISDGNAQLTGYGLPAGAASTIRAGVTGTDGQARSWQPGTGFSLLGATLLSAPAVGLLPGASGQSPVAYYVGLASDHNLWIRSDTQGWQRLAPIGTYCLDSPGLLLTGTAGSASITIVCHGHDDGVWTASGTFSSGLPFLTNWAPLGGTIKSGPAVGSVGGVITDYVIGLDNAIWTRTATTDWTQTAWRCIGHPAVATSGSTSYLACHGMDHALWYATNTGSGWSVPRSAGGTIVDGPGIAATASGATFFVEGTDHALWQNALSAGGALSGITSDGGSIQFGAQAGGL